MIEIKTDPTLRELRIFAALWFVFFAAFGWIAVRSGQGLLGLSAATTICFAISLAFNRDFPKRAQLLGALIPLGLFATWAGIRVVAAAGVPEPTIRWTLRGAFAVVGAVGAGAALADRSLARNLYRGWMFAALPIGWTVSHIMLGAVYFLVITPIGLALRLLGKDPMERRFDPSAASYWRPRKQTTDPRRYFRQS